MNPSGQNINISINTSSIVKILFLLLAAAAVYYFWDIVLSITMAVVIASAIEPATRLFVRHKIPRTLAVISIYLIAALFVSGLLYFFVAPILQNALDFLQQLPQYFSDIDLISPISQRSPDFLQPGLEKLSQTLSVDEAIRSLEGAIGNISRSSLHLLSVIFGGLISFVLVIVLSFYLSVQEDGVANFLKIIAPVRHERYVTNLWLRAQEKIGRWVQGQLILALIIGVLVYLGLTVLRVRYALLLSVLAAAAEIIPIFGPILAAIPSIAIGFLDGGMTKALIVAGLYTIIQQFENHLIYPLVVRKVVGVPPLLVIIALVIGSRVAGFIGIILSVPIAAVFREYLNDVQVRKIADGKKSSEPA